MITENLSTLKIHKLTQAQYDRELEAGRIDENALYLTPLSAHDTIPSVTADDNGKFMVVVNGAWAAEAIPEAEEASF